MTREEFDAEYELLKEIGAQGTSFHALSRDGAVVMVHFLGLPEDAETRRLLDSVSLLDPAERRRVLKVGHVDGRPLIVTKFISDFSSISKWLEIRVGGRAEGRAPPQGEGSVSAPPPAPPPPPPEVAVPADPWSAPPSSSPGEFTRMFEAAEKDKVEPRSDTSSSEPAEEASLAVEPPASPILPSLDDDGPGEFTRMFQAEGKGEPRVSREPDSEPPPSEPPPLALPAVPPSDLGEKPVWGGPLEDAAPSAPKDAGAFTRMFRKPELREEVSKQPPPLNPVVPSEQERLPPSWKNDDVYLERLRGDIGEPPPIDQPVPSMPPRSAIPQGPGEYTRVIQAASMTGPSRQPPLPPPPPSIPPPVSKGPPQKKLIGIGILVLLTALMIVLVFALIQSRANSSDEAPEQEPAGETGV